MTSKTLRPEHPLQHEHSSLRLVPVLSKTSIRQRRLSRLREPASLDHTKQWSIDLGVHTIGVQTAGEEQQEDTVNHSKEREEMRIY
jgi:hypothetical protein